MKRYAIPFAGLLCSVLSACVQPVSGPPPVAPPTPPITVTSVACPDGSPNGIDLLSRVRYVQLSVQPLAPPGSVMPGSAPPNTDFDPVTDPNIADPMPIDPALQNSLALAFAANPAFTRNELCPPFTSAGLTNPGLDGILINRAQCINPINPNDHDPSNCIAMSDTDISANSWGLRTPSGKKYVAISLGLWRCKSGRGYCAPSFTDFHQRLNQALLDRTCKNFNPACQRANITAPKFQIPAGEPDTPDLSVLTALAHERGHIYWFETFVRPPGSKSISNIAFCQHGPPNPSPPFYPGGQWRGATVDLPNNRYVEFAALNDKSSIKVANLPALLNSPNPADATIARGIVDKIFVDGQYPSLLAAYSPDEDFVEAFQWSALRNARVSDVSVNVIGSDRPILTGGHGNSQGAEQKLECFDALSQSGQR